MIHKDIHSGFPPLKLYIDRELLPKDEQYVFLLYPLWGLIREHAGDPDENRFVDYVEKGKNLFTFTSKLESDAFLLPVSWELQKEKLRSHQLARAAELCGKKLIVFYCSDSVDEIPIKNEIVFGTSGFRSRRKPNEFGLPGWSVDFLTYYSNKVSVRQKTRRPSISYSGYIDYQGGAAFLREAVKWKNASRVVRNLITRRRIQMFPDGPWLHGRAVRMLRKSKNIETRFIIRKQFSAKEIPDALAARREYADNILNADYALVVRGVGNFSYRLHEVLSCGRIPVFVDTDCILPFDHLIDWRSYMVWMDADNLESLEEKVLDFHNRLSQEEFVQLQFAIRELYEQWISPLGFFSNLWRCVRPSETERSQRVQFSPAESPK